MTPQERAVIEAAKAWVYVLENGLSHDLLQSRAQVQSAVRALKNTETAPPADTIEVRIAVGYTTRYHGDIDIEQVLGGDDKDAFFTLSARGFAPIGIVTAHLTVPQIQVVEGDVE